MKHECANQNKEIHNFIDEDFEIRIDDGIWVLFHGIIELQIFYCPWCGDRLPGSRAQMGEQLKTYKDAEKYLFGYNRECEPVEDSWGFWMISLAQMIMNLSPEHADTYTPLLEKMKQSVERQQRQLDDFVNDMLGIGQVGGK